MPHARHVHVAKFSFVFMPASFVRPSVLSVFSPKQERRRKDEAVRATIMQKLIETGERERLKDLLRERLIQCGWRDELKVRILLCASTAVTSDIVSNVTFRYIDPPLPPLRIHILKLQLQLQYIREVEVCENVYLTTYGACATSINSVTSLNVIF